MASLNWKTFIYMSIVILENLWAHTASGFLVVKPQDTYILAAQGATLNCSTSLAEDVHWYFGTSYVYAGRKLYSPYNNRLKIEEYQNDGSTAYNLVFPSAQPEDAGMYNCRDNKGRGEMSSAEITVLTADRNGTCQSNMKPDGVVIPNDCNIDPDELQLSCSATYYGNNPPKLEWKEVPESGNSVTKTECQTTNSRIVCNTSIVGDRQMNRSSFVCQTAGSSELVKLCTIEVKNLIYALNGQTMTKSSVGSQVQCNPDTSQSCNYTWKHSSIAVSTSRTITPDKTGFYQCEAECNIRGKRCVVFDYAYISDDAISTAVRLHFALLSKRNHRLQQMPNTSKNVNDLKLKSLDRLTGTRQEQDSLMKPVETIDTIVDEPELKRTLIPKAASDGQKAVAGLTILGDELFVFSDGWPKMEVFGDLQKLESRREFLLTGHQLEIPWDMQSSSKYNCLYIVDKKQNKDQHADIVRIDSEGIVQTKWIADCTAGRLSITSESNVIFTSLYKCTICEYSHDGPLIRIIKLPIVIVSPWVTLKRGKDNYITSYGHKYASGHLHGVCVIDKHGNIEDNFGRKNEQSKDPLNIPVHMAAFSDGHILVADKNNSRVVLLSPDLKFLGAIFAHARERYPNRLCLDEGNKQLFVSDYQWGNHTKPLTDGRLLVLDMSSVQSAFNINADK